MTKLGPLRQRVPPRLHKMHSYFRQKRIHRTSGTFERILSVGRLEIWQRLVDSKHSKLKKDIYTKTCCRLTPVTCVQRLLKVFSSTKKCWSVDATALKHHKETAGLARSSSHRDGNPVLRAWSVELAPCTACAGQGPSGFGPLIPSALTIAVCLFRHNSHNACCSRTSDVCTHMRNGSMVMRSGLIKSLTAGDWKRFRKKSIKARLTSTQNTLVEEARYGVGWLLKRRKAKYEKGDIVGKDDWRGGTPWEGATSRRETEIAESNVFILYGCSRHWVNLWKSRYIMRNHSSIQL